MTTTAIRLSLPLALLWIVSACSLSTTLQSGDAVGRHTLSIASLFPSSSCSSSSFNKAVYRKSTLPVIRQDTPCDPRSSGENRRNHTELLRRDDKRVASIQSKFSGVVKGQDKSLGSRDVALPATSGASLGAGDFMVNVGLGTPKKELTLIFDTGSELMWTQCQPCAVSCYSQIDPIFDPSQSSSYKNISCTTTTCTQISSGTTYMPSCAGTTCVYGQAYGDGSYTFGYFATETLTLTPTDVIENFQFGCGQDNQGIFGRVDGLIGLGRNSISLVEQTAKEYSKIFSYCLPNTSSSMGYLTLGNNGVSPAVFTPMLTLSSYPAYYGIGLVGISVGGKQLPISPTIFSNAGTIIDSGTMITRLPLTAYIELRAAFRLAMISYPMVPSYSGLDTCYDFSDYYNNVTIPNIAFTFYGEVTVNLVGNNILYPVSDTEACLAFIGNSNDLVMGIYGNTQQLTFEVIYDLPGSRIGFAPDGC